MKFTIEQYDAAIQALQDAKTQLAPDGDPCHICDGGEHQAWECRFNPLLAVLICETLAKQSDELHSTLHWLAGFDTRFGMVVGPAAMVLPDAGEPVDVPDE